MVKLSRKEGVYCVDHNLKNQKRVVYSFPYNCLPEQVLRHTQKLNVFREDEDTTFQLTEKQDLAVLAVLTKLVQERESDYFFTKHLQQTYLIELIHLITKMHHAR